MSVVARVMSVLALLGAAIAATGDTRMPPRPIAFDQYRAEVERISAQLAKLSSADEARSLQASLPDTYAVAVGAKSFDVSLTPLKKALEAYAVGSLQHQAQLLAEMQTTVAGMRAGAEQFTHPADAVATRQRSGEILARREFREVRGPTLLEIWRDRVAHWIIRWLDRIFGGIHRSQTGNRVLLWVLVAITAAFLLLWLKRISQRRQVEIVREPIPFAPSGRNWRAWLADAREAAAQGHWRDAVHFAYWAAISHLEESGAWVPDRARTPREYLRLLAATSPRQPALKELTRSFERIWYGDQPAAAPDYQQALQQVEELGCR